MKLIQTVLLFLFAAVMAGCATEPKVAEVREIADWKLVFSQKLANNGLTRHFIPAAESADSWKHRFTTTFSQMPADTSKLTLRARADSVCTRNSQEMSAQLKKSGKPDCRLMCNFISESDTSLVFEIPQSCTDVSSVYQLLRWVSAPDGMYYFSFLQKQPISPEDRTKWLTIMNSVHPAKSEKLRDYFE